MTIKDLKNDDFEIETLEDELRVDSLCRPLLQQFYMHLQEDHGLAPEKASDLAYCADYYLRDYIVDTLRQNILKPRSGQVRYFAGTWYCTRSMDPEIALLEQHIDAISRFYNFLEDRGLLDAAQLSEIRAELEDLDFYRERIVQFKKLAGDGYHQWLKACPPDLVSDGDTDAGF